MRRNDCPQWTGNCNYPAYQVFEAQFSDTDPTAIDRDFQGFLSAKALYEWNKATDTFGK